MGSNSLPGSKITASEEERTGGASTCWGAAFPCWVEVEEVMSTGGSPLLKGRSGAAVSRGLPHGSWSGFGGSGEKGLCRDRGRPVRMTHPCVVGHEVAVPPSNRPSVHKSFMLPWRGKPSPFASASPKPGKKPKTPQHQRPPTRSACKICCSPWSNKLFTRSPVVKKASTSGIRM